MREKLNTLPLSELKEMAKAQGLRGISGLRKAELIDALCRLDPGTSPIRIPMGRAEVRGNSQMLCVR